MAFVCKRCKKEDKDIDNPHRLKKYCDDCKQKVKEGRRAARRSLRKKQKIRTRTEEPVEEESTVEVD